MQLDECIDEEVFRPELCHKGHGWMYINYVNTQMEFIETLQFRYRALSWEIELLSMSTHPSFYYFYVFPLAYALAPGIGLTMLWIVTLGDIAAATAKLLFRSDRPYWWILENHGFKLNISLKQFPRTCDATYGFPSSNMLITAGAYWCIFMMIQKYRNRCERKTLFILFLTWTTILGCSELYLAKNYPDQIIASIIMGILLAEKVYELQLHSVSPAQYFALSMTVGLIIFTVFVTSPLMGIDLTTSFCLAKEHCNDIEWIYPKQNVFYLPFVESSAMLFGVGIAILILSMFFTNRLEIKFDSTKRIWSAILSILFIKAFRCIFHAGDPVNTNVVLYLMFLFLQFWSVPLIVIVFVPIFLKLYRNYY